MIDMVDVSLSYQKENMRVDILKDASFTIPTGELLALTGPSGSGKTSVLRLIAGHIKPTKGHILLDGVRIPTSEDDYFEYRAKRLGVVFQDFKLINSLSALDNIAIAAQIAGKTRSEAIESSKRLLEHLHLSERSNHTPERLSGGEQQRIALARALINSPEVLLIDEPTSNLDDDSAILVSEIITRAHQSGTTIIVATHDARISCSFNRNISISNGVLASN